MRRIDLLPKVLLEGVHEAKLPRFGRRPTVLVGVFVHVERPQVPAIDPELIDEVGDFRIGGPGIGRNDHQLPALVGGRLDAMKHVGQPEELHVRVRHDLDAEIRIGMLREILAANLPHLANDIHIAKRNERGRRILELGHLVTPDSVKMLQQPAAIDDFLN